MANNRLTFHEASHAVASLAAGFPILYLIQNADFGMLQIEPVRAAQLEDKQFRERYAIASVSGAMGELLKFGDGGLHSLSDGLGKTDCENLANSGVSLIEILAACYQAERYLKANWDAVQRVASALEKNSLMLEADIRAAAGDLPSLFEPESKAESKPVNNGLRQSFKASTKSLWMKQTAAFQSFRS